MAGSGDGKVERCPVHLVHGPAGQVGERGGDVDRARHAVDDLALGDAGAGQQQRRPGLHAVQRAVLAGMPSLVDEPESAGVHDREIGGALVGEQRVQPWTRERVRRRAIAERGLVGERVASPDRRGRAVRRDGDVPLAVGGVDGVVLAPADQGDDVRQRRVEQHVERPLTQVDARAAAGTDDGAGDQVAGGERHPGQGRTSGATRRGACCGACRPASGRARAATG